MHAVAALPRPAELGPGSLRRLQWLQWLLAEPLDQAIRQWPAVAPVQALQPVRIVGVLAMHQRRLPDKVHKPQVLHLQPGRKAQAIAELPHSAYVAH